MRKKKQPAELHETTKQLKKLVQTKVIVEQQNTKNLTKDEK